METGVRNGNRNNLGATTNPIGPPRLYSKWTDPPPGIFDSIFKLWLYISGDTTWAVIMKCFDWKGNGDKDISKTSLVAEKVGLFAEEKRPVFACIENYFKNIENNPEFKDLFAQCSR